MGSDFAKRLRASTVPLALLIGASAALMWAQSPSVSGGDETPEDVVAGIYDLVSFQTGKTPDWDKVRSLFIPEAVVVLRTSREATTVFSLEGFIGDFVSFIENTPAGEMGFSEKVVRMKSMVFGDMADVLVLYEAQITGSARGPQQGVDSFSLIKKDGRWLIVSITNEIPTADHPLPEELRS
jgi:hypothetical protein